MDYSCDTCQQPVSADVAFVRSINLRSVAWCRDCWVAQHRELGIPVQREVSAAERSPRRWALARRPH